MRFYAACIGDIVDALSVAASLLGSYTEAVCGEIEQYAVIPADTLTAPALGDQAAPGLEGRIATHSVAGRRYRKISQPGEFNDVVCFQYFSD
jgi:hypothetical protein